MVTPVSYASFALSCTRGSSSRAIVIAVAAILLVGIVTVGGYALYIWIAHPSSFAVPFHS
jgi:hypothetical protein